MEAVWSDWWMIAVSLVAAVAVIWLILAVALLLAKPKGVGMRDVLRLLPDLVRLVEHLATDPEMPRRIRIALALVLAFMASPIDVIPDFIPVIGMADDVILDHQSSVTTVVSGCRVSLNELCALELA